jgi:hypothetical protein
MATFTKAVLTAATARKLLVSAAAMFLAIACSAENGGLNKTPAGDAGLVVAAAEVGVPPGRLDVVDRFTIQLPLTGATLEVTKALDRATDRAVTVAVDQNGRAVDFDAFQRGEAARLRALDGKLDRTLADRLKKARPTEKIPVSVWVRIPDLSTRKLPRTSPARRLDAVESAVAPKVQEVVEAIEDMGGSATTARAAPAVFAELNRGQIDKLQRRADVVAIYGQQDTRTLLDDAATTLRAHNVWPSNTGAGTRVAVNEGGGVSDTNPFLNNATHPVAFYCSSSSVTCPKGKNLQVDNAHASQVAGVIASTHSQRRGIAPSTALILSENVGNTNWDADVVAANEWGWGKGADVTNMSWGTVCGGMQTFMSRYVDWAVKNLPQTFIIGAGNNYCGSNKKVIAPGVAWSAITVGAIDDVFDGFWANDTMWSDSSDDNPDFAPGMEKPEVVAVGGNVCSTDLSGVGNLCFAGTSLAAPQVAGIVADMIAVRPNQTVWPETNKAAILASASHDIEPGTSRDGVGAPVASLAVDTYRFDRFFNDHM